MSMSKPVAVALAFLALPGVAFAQTERRCISPDENEAVTGYIMPALVTELGKKCAPQLGAGSWLGANGAELQRRLQPVADGAWPQARLAAERVGGNPIPGEGTAGEVARAALAPVAAAGIAAGFDANGCRLADRLLGELAPLPPENLVGVMALFLELGIAENPEVPFMVCRAV